MVLDENLKAIESILQDYRDRTAQHFQYVASSTNLSDTIADYGAYLEKTISAEQSMLKFCRSLIAEHANSGQSFNEDVMEALRRLMANVIEALVAMKFSASVAEYLVVGTGEYSSRVLARTDGNLRRRNCSFCNKDCKGEEVLAGPTVNICISCTRLACSVLGIALQKS